MLPTFKMFSEEMNISFFDSNAATPKILITEEPMASSKSLASSLISSQESSQLGDLEEQMENACLKESEHLTFSTDVAEDVKEDDLIGDGKFHDKFMIVGDNVDVKVKP